VSPRKCELRDIRRHRGVFNGSVWLEHARVIRPQLGHRRLAVGELDRREACPPPAKPIGRRVTSINWHIRYGLTHLQGRLLIRHAPAVPCEGLCLRQVYLVDEVGAGRVPGEETIRLADKVLRYHCVPPIQFARRAGRGLCNA